MSKLYDSLCEEYPPERTPWYDRPGVDTCGMHGYKSSWYNNGLIILRDFADHALIDAYCDAWLAGHKTWRHDVPYMNCGELRDLALDSSLMKVLEVLVGHEMAIHLCLFNWTSTERSWHADDYLNPPHVNNHYAAVWFALDDIHPDSGPFEWVEGSHKWPLIRQHKLMEHFPPGMANDPYWPWKTEKFVEAAIRDKIVETDARVRQFLPARKGDVLIWSGRLVHRGSLPNVRGMERRALICHYSSVDHRKDMPVLSRHKDQGRYFVL